MVSTLVYAAGLLLAASTVHGVLCPLCEDLEGLYQQIKTKMPDERSGKYRVPSDDVLAEWSVAVAQMVAGNCNGAVGTQLEGEGYEMEQFVDVRTTPLKTFCVLATLRDADRDGAADAPWGAVVVYQGADARNLSIDVPHPLHERRTGEQGVALFKGTAARTLVVSGAHREANTDTDARSECDSGSFVADAAHNADTTFQAGVAAIKQHYDTAGQRHTAIQLHGMVPGRGSACDGVDGFITHGSRIAAREGEAISQLRREIAQRLPSSSSNVDVPGMGSCNKFGRTNVQGRLLNGIPPAFVCPLSANRYSGRFIHIEQTHALRAAENDARWVAALNAVDFEHAAPSRGYVVQFPTPGAELIKGQRVTLRWQTIDMDNDPVRLSINLDDSERRFKEAIAREIPDQQELEYTVESDLPEGNVLFRIRSQERTQIATFVPVTVRRAHFAVLAPRAGETLVAGQPYVLRWENEMPSATVSLRLHRGTVSRRPLRLTIVRSTADDGEYEFTLPAGMPAGDDYWLNVGGRFSAAPFRIIGA